MIYVRPLTTVEVEELNHMTQHAVGRVSRRAHLMLLSAQHRSVPDLASLFACSPATVRFWLRRFGVRWRRPRRAMPRTPDPQQAATQWHMAAAVVGAPPDIAIVDADESRIQPLPLVRAMWQPRGQHVRVSGGAPIAHRPLLAR